MSSEEKSRSEEDGNSSDNEENEDEEEESEHGSNSEEEDENILSNSSKNESGDGDLSDRSHSDNSQSFLSSENEKKNSNSDEEIINLEEINKNKFGEKKLLLSKEIKFEISMKDENKNLIKSDIDKSNFISTKEISRKSSNVKPYDKSLAFKILNEVSCNLDKLEKDLNQNLKRITILDKNRNSEKKSKMKKETINNFSNISFPKNELNSSEGGEERIKIKKRRDFSEKEVNTDWMGVMGPTGTGRLQNMDSSRYKNSRNDFNDNKNRESLRESGKFTNTNKDRETQNLKNYERNTNNNFANSHFRTIEDLYRHPYQNTQPVIYNRDDNARNNKISQNSFYPVKYSNTNWNKKFSDVDSEDLRRPQEKYIKIQKNLNNTKNITQAMDILLEKRE